jgi:hypothetical protein
MVIDLLSCRDQRRWKIVGCELARPLIFPPLPAMTPHRRFPDSQIDDHPRVLFLRTLF